MRLKTQRCYVPVSWVRSPKGLRRHLKPRCQLGAFSVEPGLGRDLLPASSGCQNLFPCISMIEFPIFLLDFCRDSYQVLEATLRSLPRAPLHRRSSHALNLCASGGPSPFKGIWRFGQDHLDNLPLN